MCGKLLGLSAFLSLTNLIRPADNGRLCRNFQKKSTSRIYKLKSRFLCNLHKIPKIKHPGGPHPHMPKFSSPAASGSQGRSSPVGSPYGNFFVESRSPVGSHIFPKLFPFTRSGRIWFQQKLKPVTTFKCSVVFYLPAQ